MGRFHSEAFALHIAETLSAMGHQVGRFEMGPRRLGTPGAVGARLDQVWRAARTASDSLALFRSRRTRRLCAVSRRLESDLTIVTHDFLWPQEVQELKRRARGTVVMWFPDALANFGRGYFMNAGYDAVFFKDPYIVTVLRDVLESPVYYLPECFNPARHVTTVATGSIDPSYRCDIATAGTLHSWRVALLKHLSGYDVRVWGSPPPLWLPVPAVARMHQGRQALNAEKARVFKGAKIVLNNLHYGEIWGLNARAFEAAGIGAFQLVNWRPGLAQLFEDGKELVSFRSVTDLREKIQYWLPREEERRQIAEAGRRRAYREHTYEQRLRLLLDTLGGAQDGYPLPALASGRSTCGEEAP